jgi:hypothetical protein
MHTFIARADVREPWAFLPLMMVIFLGFAGGGMGGSST